MQLYKGHTEILPRFLADPCDTIVWGETAIQSATVRVELGAGDKHDSSAFQSVWSCRMFRTCSGMSSMHDPRSTRPWSGIVGITGLCGFTRVFWCGF